MTDAADPDAWVLRALEVDLSVYETPGSGSAALSTARPQAEPAQLGGAADIAVPVAATALEAGSHTDPETSFKQSLQGLAGEFKEILAAHATSDRERAAQAGLKKAVERLTAYARNKDFVEATNALNEARAFGATFKKACDAAKVMAEPGLGTSNGAQEQQFIRSEFEKAAEFLISTARQNASNFGQQVGTACNRFSAYAQKEVESRASHVTVGDLMKALAAIILEALGGALAKKVADSSKPFISKFTKLLTSKLDGVIEKDADLKTSIAQITKAAVDGATALQDLADTEIVARAKIILNDLAKGKPLTKTQVDFIWPVYENSSKTDDLIESYGIPSHASANRVQGEVLKTLIFTFEKECLKHSQDMSESIEVVLTSGGRYADPHYVDDKARKRAEAAAKAMGY